MPKLFEWKGWIFLFYSLDCLEPPHVHVRKDRKELKIWLADLSVARNQRCTAKDISDILSVVQVHKSAFLEKWHEHFAD